MKLELEETSRGFKIASFVDINGDKCSIQESSLATDDAIWLGMQLVEGKPARMHLNRQLVIDLLPHLATFIQTGRL